MRDTFAKGECGLSLSLLLLHWQERIGQSRSRPGIAMRLVTPRQLLIWAFLSVLLDNTKQRRQVASLAPNMISGSRAVLR